MKTLSSQKSLQIIRVIYTLYVAVWGMAPRNVRSTTNPITMEHVRQCAGLTRCLAWMDVTNEPAEP
jgi:hypothetical protein